MDLPAERMNTTDTMPHMPMVQPTEQPCTSPSGSRGQDYMPLAYVSRSALSREHWRLALSKLEKSFEARKHMGPCWAASFFTHQLMTP